MGCMESAAHEARRGLREWLFHPIDSASLVYFRVLFGFLLCCLVSGRLLFLVKMDWIREYYLDPPILFQYYGFEWVHPWPGYWLYVHFGVISLSALGIMLGCLYRLSAIVFFLSWTYYFLLERAFYLNHFYLVCLFALLLVFMSPHHAHSLDAHWRPTIRSDVAPAWNLYAIRLQMGLVYFFAAVAKMRPDWLRGDVVRSGVSRFESFPVAGGFLASEAGVYLFTYGGLLFDLLVFPALLYRKTRPWAILAAACFHGFNVIAFNIDVFPWLAFGTTLMFLSPSWPRRALARFHRWFPQHVEPAERGALRDAEDTRRSSAARQRVTMALLGVYFLVQLALPLRQFLYEGDPKWHEYGQRWAWRMMAGGKTGHADFVVRDPATGETWNVDPAEYLNPRQLRKLAGDPDCMIQFSHFLAQEFAARGYENVEVRANTAVSFNGRPEQPLVDPTVDLAKQQRSVTLPNWVLSLKE